MPDNVEVRIVGDASGVAPAVEQTTSEVGGLKAVIADINAFIDSARAKFMQFGVAGAEAGQAVARGMGVAVAATEAEGNAITRMIMKVHEGAESVRTFQMRAKEFAEVYVALFAIEGIAHWIEALGEAAEKTEHLSAIMGMSVGRVQALSGAATMSGISIDSISRAMGQLDNKSVTVTGHTTAGAKALHAMGIAANDGSTTMQRLLTIADKFHSIADGPEKTALAMQLFGKAGKEMIPFLNQGSAAIQDLMEKTKELGGVNEAAVEQGARMASSLNESKVAWEGLKNTLTQAFGPVLTELVDGFIALVKAMVDSYNSGGFMKQLFDSLTYIIQGFIEIVYDVGKGLSELFNNGKTEQDDWGNDMHQVVNTVVDLLKNLIVAIVYVADAFKASWDLIKAAGAYAAIAYHEVVGSFQISGTMLGEFMKVVGKVVWDALHLNWGAIASDWDNGMNQVKGAVQEKTDQILAITGHLRQQATSDFNAAMNLGKSFDDFQKSMFSGHYGGPAHDNFKFNFGGGAGDDPDIKSTPGGKQKKPKDDLLARLQEELEAKKAAWEKEQLAQDTAQEFSLQSEADFWDAALKRTDLSAKDRYKITKKWIEAEQKLQKERISAVLDEDKKEIFEADKNAQAKLAIVQKEAAFIKRTYGENSKEARAAAFAVLQAEREADLQRIALVTAVVKAKQDAANEEVNEAEKNAELEEQLGLISKGKLLQQERTFEQQRFQIDMQALQQRKALIDPARDPAGYQAINLQIEALERQHQAKLTQIDRQAVLQRTEIERQAISQISSSWGQAVGQMMTGQITFRDGVIQMWQGLVQAIGNAIASIVQQWLTQLLTSLIIGKVNTAAAGASTITTHAAEAAAGAYAATAAIPYIGPELAPAAAATAFGGAISWISLLGAEGGDYHVREGLYHLHENEMVLPAWAASPLRSMIEASDKPSFMASHADPTRSQGSISNGGDAHYHYEPRLEHHDTTWEKLMRKSDREARRWFTSQARSGRLMPPQS